MVPSRNPRNLFYSACFLFSMQSDKRATIKSHMSVCYGFGQITSKLWILYYYANYVPKLSFSLAESRSISYFSPDVRAPIKLSNAF